MNNDNVADVRNAYAVAERKDLDELDQLVHARGVCFLCKAGCKTCVKKTSIFVRIRTPLSL
jgi:hypothetical protein